MKLLVRGRKVRLDEDKAPAVAWLALHAGWVFGGDPHARAVLSQWLFELGHRAAALAMSRERDGVTLSLLGLHMAAVNLLPATPDHWRTARAIIKSLIAVGDHMQALDMARLALERWPRQRLQLLTAALGLPGDLLLPLVRNQPPLEAAVLYACGRYLEALQLLDADEAPPPDSADVKLLRASLEIRTGSPGHAELLVNSALAQQGLRPVSFAHERPGIAGLACDAVQIDTGPLVSVVIPVHNLEVLIEPALRSVLAQDHRALEVVVVDDASDDKTASVVGRIARSDGRVTLLRQLEQGGAYRARNRGLAAATGEFITFHDGDDWSHPQKITEQLESLRAQPQAVACVSDWVRMRDDGSFVDRHVFPLIRMNTSSLMFRRAAVLERAGLFDDVRTGADSEFQARLELLFGGAKAVWRTRKLLSFATWRDDSLMNDPATGYTTAEGTQQRLEYWERWNRQHARAGRAWNPAARLRNGPSHRAA